MPTDIQQIATIKSQTLARMAEITAQPKPTYQIDGQLVAWGDYLTQLQRTIDWCNEKLAGERPFEIQSQGFSEHGTVRDLTTDLLPQPPAMFNPSTDLAVVLDGAEAVTLLCRGRDPGTPGVAIAHAFRRAMTTSEATVINQSDVRKYMASDGQCTASDVVWHLPAAELPDAPALGDVILDAAGQRWTILEVKRVTLGSRWRCPARNLVVAHRLDDTLTILKAAYAKSDCGAVEAVWQTWRTGVRAHPAGRNHDDRRWLGARRWRSIAFSWPKTWRWTRRTVCSAPTARPTTSSAASAPSGSASCK